MNEQHVIFSKEFITPNNKNFQIYVNPDDYSRYVLLSNLSRNLGYQGCVTQSNLLLKIINEKNFHIHIFVIDKQYCGKLPYRFISLDKVPIIVKALIEKLPTDRSSAKSHYLLCSQRFLEWLENFSYFKDISDVTSNVTSENLTENQKEITDSDIKEDLQMTDTGVTTLTVSDIDDIKSRAEALKEAFDVTKKDALRAVIQLKSEEINRDLTPLMNLLQIN